MERLKRGHCPATQDRFGEGGIIVREPVCAVLFQRREIRRKTEICGCEVSASVFLPSGSALLRFLLRRLKKKGNGTRLYSTCPCCKCNQNARPKAPAMMRFQRGRKDEREEKTMGTPKTELAVWWVISLGMEKREGDNENQTPNARSLTRR